VATAYINKIGTAVPAYDVHHPFIDYGSSLLASERAQRLFGAMAERWQIEHCYSFLQPNLTNIALGTRGFYQRERFPDTPQRMQFFGGHAFGLAARALDDLGFDAFKDDVTHLIIVTEFYARGLDVDIVERFGLKPPVERTILGFMGCYAAIPALKLARHIVRSDPQAKVVIVNLELCTIHLQETEDIEQILCFLLWGDSCAASLVSAEESGIELQSFHAVIPETWDQMAWRVGAFGFDMLLSGQVALSLARAIPRHVQTMIGGRRLEDITLWALHPGGRSILDSIGQALGLGDEALRHSREVLRRFGKMSSATLMFVEKSMLSVKSVSRLGCTMAFGPGLTAESMIFEVAAQPASWGTWGFRKRNEAVLHQGVLRMSSTQDEIIGMIVKRIRAAPERVTLAASLDELGLESLDVIEMAFDIEERFNIEIPFNANNNTGPAFKTVGDVVVAVQRLIVSG
jgi:alpha-pyrone synthase